MLAEKDENYKDYKLESTVPSFMKKEFVGCRLSFIKASENDRNSFPDIEVLKDADLLVLAVRRRALPQKQFEIFKNFLNSGKALIALRTSNHGFTLRNYKASKNSLEWKTFDEEVLGGKNKGYLACDSISIESSGALHPILKGVNSENLKLINSKGSLYRIGPLKNSCEVLLFGKSAKEKQPVAWVNTYKSSKVFYTSLGQVNDFKKDEFKRLLMNAINWGLKN